MFAKIINLLISLSVLCIALFHQHYMGMRPCAWCIMQRIVFFSILIVSILALLFKTSKKSYKLWIIPLAILGAGIGLYQLLVANTSPSCKMSLAEKFINFTQINSLLPQVFEVYAMCNKANVNFLGLPYTAWSLISFVIIIFITIFGIKKFK